VWQPRFWEHTIRDEDDFRRHVDYVHWNPVKHGYARRAFDWPYSTFRRYVARGIYTPVGAPWNPRACAEWTSKASGPTEQARRVGARHPPAVAARMAPSGGCSASKRCRAQR
jgi:hypothetical protein